MSSPISEESSIEVPQQPLLVTFTGAGGTGKTTLVNALQKRLPNNSIIHRSIVRDYYEMKGVANEAAFLKLPDKERHNFQIGLFKFYLAELSKVRDAYINSGTVILCERSVFDHFAYTLYGSRELVGSGEMNLLNWGVSLFLQMSPVTFYLPYPTPWDKNADDGFRAREPAKDTLVDAMIHKLLHRSRSAWSGTLPFVSEEERVAIVISNIYNVNTVPKPLNR